MKKDLKFWMAVVLMLALLSSACMLLPAPAAPAKNDATIAAYAAGTIAAIASEQAPFTSPTSPPVVEPPTATHTPLPQAATLVPTSTPFPTPTPIPTLTPLPTLTPVRLTATVPGGGSSSGGSGGSGGGGGGFTSYCNSAEFIEDETIPPGTQLTPNEIFTKVWRVRNNGTCTWTNKYSLVFDSGNKMSGSNKSLPNQVKPGQEINLSVSMKAPEKKGEYAGFWMLKSSNGSEFGTGSNAANPLKVEIEVVKGDGNILYNFVSNYCAARWETKNNTLPCPGTIGDPQGFVVALSNPELESRNEDEPALWTQPEDSDTGYITGTYPSIKINSGDHFVADVGCLNDYNKCNVIFRLRYQIGDDDPVELGHWNEVYDGETTRIDEDLSALDGESVKIILMVKVNDHPADAAAFWLVPRIAR